MDTGVIVRSGHKLWAGIQRTLPCKNRTVNLFDWEPMAQRKGLGMKTGNIEGSRPDASDSGREGKLGVDTQMWFEDMEIIRGGNEGEITRCRGRGERNIPKRLGKTSTALLAKNGRYGGVTCNLVRKLSIRWRRG